VKEAEEVSIARPPRNAGPPVREGPRINELITVTSVRLVDADGEMRGVVSTEEALEHAAQAGLDLVEVSPNADPPVCKILDYGKLKYQEQKKKSEARKKQKIIEVKEIKMRPNIDTHDYDVKMRAIRKFIGEGDKVKVTHWRGRQGQGDHPVPRARNGASGTWHAVVGTRARGNHRRNQSRTGTSHGRPANDHGAGVVEVTGARLNDDPGAGR
jgi:translation initiation factor IF-3